MYWSAIQTCAQLGLKTQMNSKHHQWNWIMVLNFMLIFIIWPDGVCCKVTLFLVPSKFVIEPDASPTSFDNPNEEH